jgi:hypothetical protein
MLENNNDNMSPVVENVNQFLQIVGINKLVTKSHKSDNRSWSYTPSPKTYTELSHNTHSPEMIGGLPVPKPVKIITRRSSESINLELENRFNSFHYRNNPFSFKNSEDNKNVVYPPTENPNNGLVT